MADTMTTVVYTGGCCGDLITALIDLSNTELVNGRVKLPAERQRLKKPHLFSTDQQRHDYMSEISRAYRSIPSHDFDYHQRMNHDMILITVEDPAVALWAATRFQALHRPQVWQEMQQKCGASTVENYAEILINWSRMVCDASDQVLDLARIGQGHAIEDLENLLQSQVTLQAKYFYNEWLQCQNSGNRDTLRSTTDHNHAKM
jgi:hypothetical protein